MKPKAPDQSHSRGPQPGPQSDFDFETPNPTRQFLRTRRIFSPSRLLDATPNPVPLCSVAPTLRCGPGRSHHLHMPHPTPAHPSASPPACPVADPCAILDEGGKGRPDISAAALNIYPGLGSASKSHDERRAAKSGDERWKLNIALWRRLTPYEKFRWNREFLAADVAQSMAFEGEEVPAARILQTLDRITPTNASAPVRRSSAAS